MAAAAALAEMSLLAADRDDWPRAERKAGQALEMIATGHLQQHLFSITSYTAAARVAAHQRDRQTARRHVGMTLRLYTAPSPAAFPWLSAQVALTLGQTFLDLGDFVAARHWAEEARGHLTRLLTEGTLRDQLRRLSADLARQGGHVRVPSPMALSPAEMRVLQLLPTHLSLGEIGDELYTSRNTVGDSRRRGLPEAAVLQPHSGGATWPRPRPARILSRGAARCKQQQWER